MSNPNQPSRKRNALLRWGLLLALLSLCGWLFAAAALSQGQDRALWDKQFEEARANARGQGTKPKPSPSPAEPGAPTATVAGDELLGLTFWRLRPATSDNTLEPRLSVEQRGQGTKSYRLERADIETPFQAGEMVRLSVETTRAADRYLYVIDREVYADKTMGEPYLIFPGGATPPGGNVIAAGKLAYVPAQGDPLPYFTLQRKRPDHVGEMLTLILSPEPLPLAELPASGAPLKLDAALVKQWEQRWGGPTERREARGGAGKEWTKAEQEAERGQGMLADPLPQTIYGVKSKADGIVVVTVLLKIAFSAQNRNTVKENKPELVVQLGHSFGVDSVAFSPNGQLVLTGGQDGTARLWDARSGKELRQLVMRSGAVPYGTSLNVQSVRFSPDGQKILTGSDDGTARLWDAKAGQELWRSEKVSTGRPVRAVTFSPDGKRVLIASDGGSYTQLLDAASGKELRRQSHIAPVNSVAFLQNKPLALVGYWDGPAQLCDAVSGKKKRTVLGRPFTFSADGRLVVTLSGNTVWLWESENGKELRRFVLDQRGVTAIAVSTGGRFILIGFQDGHARLLDVASGDELQRFVGHTDAVDAVAFSPDGQSVVTGGGLKDRTARLWDVTSGQELQCFRGHRDSVDSIAFSHDGQQVLMGSVGDTAARLWDVAKGQELRRFGGHSEYVTAVAFSSDGRLMMTGDHDGARLWDARTGHYLRKFGEHSEVVNAMAFSPNGRLALIGSQNGRVRLWDVATGQELRRFVGHSDAVRTAAFSPDGQLVLTGSQDGACLWDVAEGKELRRFVSYSLSVDWDALSKKKSILDNPWLRLEQLLWTDSVAYWKYLERYSVWKADRVSSVAFSPNGRAVLTGGGGSTRLWDAMSGIELHRYEVGSSSLTSVAFSPDGLTILTGHADSTVWLLDAASGQKLQHFEGHSSDVTVTSYSLNGRMVLTGSWDGTVRLWDGSTGKELCRFISFHGKNWIAVTSDGRFDTNNLEEIESLHWIVPDQPLQALPLEIFMRNYYEPRLWARVLAGEHLLPVPDLSKLNRVQPIMRITEIKPQTNAPNAVADTVTVTVEIANATGAFTRDGKQVTLESGAHDLRLFRDGQLVGYAPEQDGPIKLESGKATITFKDIKLPRRADLKQVEFSAYAFNVDRVKSETARQTYVLPRPLPAVKGRAYVIAVGVNAYENAALDLSFAANDARRLQGVLSEKLKATGEYAEVVPITLLSDYEWKDGRRAITAAQATKGNVNAVLDLLAGRQVDLARLAGVANADRLRQARPEDLVIISFASHGYADEAGRFYFVTYDTGAGTEREITPEVLQRSISSDELSRWLRDVDAGELAMIVDACQSAAAVEGEGFKPGPMGSRGLGQLAYDKGMRILAATQADNAALEDGLIRQGLLTYALVRDGIELGRADFKPADKTITLGEWLSYALDRVPQLFAEVNSGQVRSGGAGVTDAPKVVLLPQKGAPPNQAGPTRLLLQGKPVSAAGKLTLAEEQIQRPALFDFARKRRDVVLLRK